MNDTTYTDLETKVLDLLLDGKNPVLESLRRQLRYSHIRSRMNTGVGYYLTFTVPYDLVLDLPNVKPSFSFGDVDVWLNIGDHQQNVGFLLWVEDGLINTLEAYTYGEEKWPERVDEFRLRYFNDQRDLNSLKQNWEK